MQVSVLLVEDDPSTADLYALKLRMDGFAVHIAGDVTTADIIFERANPTVVLVDTRLPDASGRVAAERYARTNSNVVLLTNDRESYERPPAGVAAALMKSRTNPRQLSEAIRDLIRTGTSKN